MYCIGYIEGKARLTDYIDCVNTNVCHFNSTYRKCTRNTVYMYAYVYAIVVLVPEFDPIAPLSLLSPHNQAPKEVF